MTDRAIFPMLCLVLSALLAGGCASPPRLAAPVIEPGADGHTAAFARAERTLRELFPLNYQATQRAIITAGGKQFTCDGLLQAGPTGSLHLAIVSSFGVVTDLRVLADGRTELLKVTPLFREDWSRRYVARDLRWLFLPPVGLFPAGRLADDRLVLETPPDAAGVTARYTFSSDGTSWQQLDLLRAGKIFYRAMPKNCRPLAGGTHEVPRLFEVTAEAYRLELRIVEMKVLKAEVQP